MTFPIQIVSTIKSHSDTISRTLILNKGLTILLGPNGSGKTHLLRGLKNSFRAHASGKKVRFLSAGRMGMLEQFRSDFDGHRGTELLYEKASYGSKDDSRRRHEMETLNGDFQTLAERADILIKVQERLRKLFKRDIMVEWSAGNLKVLFSRLNDGSEPYSSGREASGLMHLVGILSALYDDEVGVLLLDEPEVSLHPQLQAFLLNEIIGVAGDPSEGGYKKLVVIATHSTEMVRISQPEDLLSLAFCYDLNADPVQIASDAGELKNKKIQGLVARLGQEHKLSLFSKRPLLVEGPSDAIICSALSSKTDTYLEASGSQLLPVIGKGQMPIVTKLLRLMGKEPVALADADGFADGLDLVNQFVADCPVADQEAVSRGFPSAAAMAGAIYSDFCNFVDDHWSEFSGVFSLHPYWAYKKDGEDDMAKRRSAFCSLFEANVRELEKLSIDNAWIAIRKRLSSLLDVMEKSGLYILRKGTIESYYQMSDRLTSIGKPTAATDEMEFIRQSEQNEVRTHYEDIIRCIQYASNTESICEADALRDLLLAVVAPAHARLKAGENVKDYNLLARSILGERSGIFDLAVRDDSLVISIASKILRVSGFPLTIHKNDDPSHKVSLALAGNAQ